MVIMIMVMQVAGDGDHGRWQMVIMAGGKEMVIMAGGKRW